MTDEEDAECVMLILAGKARTCSRDASCKHIARMGPDPEADGGGGGGGFCSCCVRKYLGELGYKNRLREGGIKYKCSGDR